MLRLAVRGLGSGKLRIDGRLVGEAVSLRGIPMPRELIRLLSLVPSLLQICWGILLRSAALCLGDERLRTRNIRGCHPRWSAGASGDKCAEHARGSQDEGRAIVNSHTGFLAWRLLQ
jgi:hypothetical protein